MLGWSMLFLIVALVSAFLGYTGIAGAATNIALLLFWVFVVLFVLTLIANTVRGSRTPVP